MASEAAIVRAQGRVICSRCVATDSGRQLRIKELEDAVSCKNEKGNTAVASSTLMGKFLGKNPLGTSMSTNHV